MRVVTRIMLKRTLLCVAVFAVIHGVVMPRWEWPVQQWILDMARAAGCHAIYEDGGVMARGRGGPFAGDDLKERFFNYAADRGAWWVSLMAAFASVACVYGVCVRLERTRVLGYRGETRCGGCGYGLTGLKEPKCPECGRAI